MEPTLDIVNLIERNPITRISEGCNERMIKKVKERFTDTQQQLFIASFYCYLNYDQTNDFVVDLENVWEWTGFTHKHKAKKMLLKNFIEKKDYKVLINQQVDQKNEEKSQEKSKVLLIHMNGQKNDENSSDEEEKKDNRGGHNKQTVLMTIQTFKLFCLKAGTKKASEIQEYYLKLENLIQEVLQEECVELKNKLQNEKANTSKKIHNNTLECYLKKNVVYLCELKEHEGKKIIKIGSSQNLKERLANIKNTYKCDPKLLYVLECQDNVKFERFLHKHQTIRAMYINMENLENYDVKSRETYLVSPDECDNLVQTIKDLYKEYSKNPTTQEEDDKNKLEVMNKEIELLQLRNRNLELEVRLLELEEQKARRLELEEQKYEAEIEKYENSVVINNAEPVAAATATSTIAMPSPQIRVRANTRSPIVYKYNHETAQVLERYDSIIDALRSNPGTSASALKSSAQENTIYHGFRWLIVERNRDTNTAPEMPPTVQRNTYVIDYVAMLDINREKIVQVFSSQKDAAISRKFKGFTTISRAIKNKGISSGHYWDLFVNCPESMKEEYLRTNTLPEPYSRPNSTYIEQIHPTTGEVIEKYNSVSDVTLKFQMSRTTLKKVAEKNEIYNGFKWRIFKNE